MRPKVRNPKYMSKTMFLWPPLTQSRKGCPSKKKRPHTSISICPTGAMQSEAPRPSDGNCQYWPQRGYQVGVLSLRKTPTASGFLWDKPKRGYPNQHIAKVSTSGMSVLTHSPTIMEVGKGPFQADCRLPKGLFQTAMIVGDSARV